MQTLEKKVEEIALKFRSSATTERECDPHGLKSSTCPKILDLGLNLQT